MSRETWGTETSKYPQEKKEKSILWVAASESERAQTRGRNTTGVKDYRSDSRAIVEHVGKHDQRWWKSSKWNGEWHSRIQSTARHEEPGWKSEGPPSKAKYSSVTDSGEVPWGKGEKNPGRGVKENLKPYVYKQTKRCICAMSYFL